MTPGIRAEMSAIPLALVSKTKEEKLELKKGQRSPC